MPCHTSDCGDTRNRPHSIIVSTQVHYSYDAWWDLGARELLRTCNLETVKRLFRFQLWSNWQLPQQSLLERSPSRIDDFLNELGISVGARTHAEKVSRVISELQVDTDDSNDDSEDDDAEDDETEDAGRDGMLNYILQSADEKAVAEALLNITSPKFARIRFKDLVRCITRTHEKEVFHNFLVRLLCARLRECPEYRPRCDRLKKVRLN